MNIEQLKTAFLTLAPEQQQDFCDYALALSQDAEDSALAAAWLAESQRRLAGCESGALALIPAAQVLAELRDGL